MNVNEKNIIYCVYSILSNNTFITIVRTSVSISYTKRVSVYSAFSFVVLRQSTPNICHSMALNI